MKIRIKFKKEKHLNDVLSSEHIKHFDYDVFDERTIVINFDWLSGDSKSLQLNKVGIGKLLFSYQYIEYYFIEK